MATSTYKGDSPGKRVVRARMWLRMGHTMSHLAPFNGGIVMGGHAGDLGVLDALAYPLDKVTSFELNEDCRDYCDELYPHKEAVLGDIGVGSREVRFNAAHIDFCGKISIEHLKLFSDVFESIEDPGCIMLTALKGREKREPAASKRLLFEGVPRLHRRQALKAARKGQIWPDLPVDFPPNLMLQHLLDNSEFNPMKLIGIAGQAIAQQQQFWQDDTLPVITKKGTIGPFGQALARIDVMKSVAELVTLVKHWKEIHHTRREYLMLGEPGCFQHAIALPNNCPSQRIGRIGSVVTYHSKSKKDHGTPFVCGLVYVINRRHEAALHKILTSTKAIRYQHWDATDSMEALIPTVLAFSKGMTTPELSKLFDIPEPSITAWKAHESRGTYDNLPKVSMRVEETSNKGLRGMFMLDGWGPFTVGIPTDYLLKLLRKGFDPAKHRFLWEDLEGTSVIDNLKDPTLDGFIVGAA